MAKNEPTLFERLETESERTIQEEQSLEGPRYSLAGRICIIVCTILICALLFPGGFGENQRLAVGEEWHRETLIAEYPFPIYKPQQVYTTETLYARDSTPFIFTNAYSAMYQEAIIEQIFTTLTANLSHKQPLSQETLRELRLSQETIQKLALLSPTKRMVTLQNVRNILLTFQKLIYNRGFINCPRSFVKTSTVIVRLNANSEQSFITSYLVDSAAYKIQWDKLIQDEFEDVQRAVATDLFPKFYQPNLHYSEEYTEIAARIAELSVPRTNGIVHKGEIIVAKGEHLSESTIQKIRSAEYSRFLFNKGSREIFTFIGNILHTVLLYGMFIIYLYIIRKRIFFDNAKLLGVSAPIVVIAFLCWWSTKISSALPLQFFIGVPVMAMLIAIVFDSRTTFTLTVTMALFLAVIRGNDYETALGALLAGTFAGYSVRDLRSRTQLFKSIAFIFAGYAMPILAIGAKNSSNITDIVIQLSFAAITAAFSPITTLGLLFIIERLFNITTDLRLLEYDNINHPLLTELNEKAPGTYQHSLMVARLAESAALSIEANPILIKVGAYFHDIGKMRKAEYFVENQINIANKHDRMPALKSAGIIRQHVEEGIELARNYKLPQRIIDFIPMHHGTMVIRYFYTKALDESGGNNKELSESDFRYPGPKPNSKETAILMLADAVEAVSHTIDTNNRDELEIAIETIIEERLLDRQFDEADITMSEIKLIKESFVKNLLGTGHQRIKYKNLTTKQEAQ